MSVGSLLEIAGNELGPRFRLLGFLPSFVLAISIFFMIFSLNEKPSAVPNIDVILSEIETLTLQQGIIVGIAVTVFSIIVHPLQLPLIRILEGYWGNSRLAEFFGEIGKDLQRGRLRELKEEGPPIYHNTELMSEKKKLRKRSRVQHARSGLRQYYPRQEDRLLPTSLGNILRAAEDTAGDRYGFDALIIWPRLYSLLPENVRSIVDDQRNQLDVTARFCTIFLVISGISFVFYLAILHKASMTDLPLAVGLSSPSLIDVPFAHVFLWIGLAIKYGLWLSIPISALVLSWLSYLGAKSAALSYGTGIQTAFDLHRFDLLKALHLPLPEDLSSERESNIQLSNFLIDYRQWGKNTNFHYLHQDNENKGKKTGSPFP